MHPIIESNRQAVAELCRRSGVNRLELFGSAARDDFDEATSDIDLLVEFGERASSAGLAPYFDLKDALEQIFSRSVDLVEIGTVRNPYVRAQIERDRQMLYAS
jgi:uncharacterized protein